MPLSDQENYFQHESRLTGVNILRLRDSTSRIQRITADFRSHRIKESAALELIQQVIEYLEPTLKMYNKPLMLWPLPIHELLHAIKRSGFKIPLVEDMFFQQELTSKLVMNQPKITNVEVVDAINQTRTATIAAAMENALHRCMERLKIDPNQAKRQLVCQEHLQEPDGNIFFVVWDNETNQEVSKRIYYKELLNLK